MTPLWVPECCVTCVLCDRGPEPSSLEAENRSSWGVDCCGVAATSCCVGCVVLSVSCLSERGFLAAWVMCDRHRLIPVTDIEHDVAF